MLHVLADAVTSMAAIAALGGAWIWGWTWLDPLVAIAAAGVILAWAWGLAKETAAVLLDADGSGLMRRHVATLLTSDGDTRVADLHVWSLGGATMSVAATVVSHSARSAADYRQRLRSLSRIRHAVIQVEACASCTTGGP